MKRVAVVILNYNGEALLPTFLPSVIRNSPGAAIIVADNGSSDKSVAILEKDFPEVELIRLSHNHGFCGGYNLALRQVQSDYYVLLNSDVEVTPGWLEPMTTILDAQPEVAAVQPKILSYRERDHFEYAGAGGGFIDALGYPFCRGRVFDFVEKDQHQYDDQCEVFWASGACMLIRSEVYHRFGGLDEDFFAHMEEIDLCWKIHRDNLKVFYTGRSVVYHLGAGTLGYANPRKTYLNFRNGLSMLIKHLGGSEMVWKLPLRVMLDWAAVLMFIIKREPAHAGAVLKAHAHTATRWSINLRKRRALRKEYPAYSRSAIYCGAALLHYFVLGRKRLP